MAGNIWISLRVLGLSDSTGKQLFAIGYVVVALAATGFMVYTLYQLTFHKRKWDELGFDEGRITFWRKGKECAECRFPDSVSVIRALPNGEITVFIFNNADELCFALSDFGDSRRKVAEYLLGYFPCLYKDKDENKVSLLDLPEHAKDNQLEYIDFDVQQGAQQDTTGNQLPNK